MNLRVRLRKLSASYESTGETLTLEQRLKRLCITPEQEEHVRQLPFHALDSSVHVTELDKPLAREIHMTDLVGTARPDATNDWVDYLDSLHKMVNFEHDPESFHRILMDPPYDNLPEVIKYCRGYYIAGNGKHRLTIGKCVGVATAKVLITGYGVKDNNLT